MDEILLKTKYCHGAVKKKKKKNYVQIVSMNQKILID